MIKIIGQSSNYTAGCDNCGAKLSFAKDDVREGDMSTSDESYGEYRSVIVCPGCNNKIDVAPKMGTQIRRERTGYYREDHDL